MDEVGTRRQSFRSLWLQHRFTVVCVFAALVASFFTYHVFSDGDFSFLMTLGSLCVAAAGLGRLHARAARGLCALRREEGARPSSRARTLALTLLPRRRAPSLLARAAG